MARHAITDWLEGIAFKVPLEGISRFLRSPKPLINDLSSTAPHRLLAKTKSPAQRVHPIILESSISFSPLEIAVLNVY